MVGVKLVMATGGSRDIKNIDDNVNDVQCHLLKTQQPAIGRGENPQFPGGGQTAPKLPHPIANTTKSSTRVTRLS